MVMFRIYYEESIITGEKNSKRWVEFLSDGTYYTDLQIMGGRNSWWKYEDGKIYWKHGVDDGFIEWPGRDESPTRRELINAIVNYYFEAEVLTQTDSNTT